MSADTDMQPVNVAIFDGLSGTLEIGIGDIAAFVAMSADVNVQLDDGLGIAYVENRASTWYGNAHNASFNLSDDNPVDFMFQTGDNFIAASTTHAEAPTVESSPVGIKTPSLSWDLVVDGTAATNFLEGGNSISSNFAGPTLGEIVQAEVSQDGLRPIVPVDDSEVEMLPSQSCPVCAKDCYRRTQSLNPGTKFNRSSKKAIEGNNKSGRRGRLRCVSCRGAHRKVYPFWVQTHGQCLRADGSDRCYYCIKRGIDCILQWGPKKEESLRLTQLATPTDAVVSEDVGWRLDYLRNHFHDSWVYGLFQKTLSIYGNSMGSPSLQAAILALLSPLCPYEPRRLEYTMFGFDALWKRDQSSLTEGDLFAIVLLAMSAHRLVYDPKSLPSKLRPKLPAPSKQLQWFMEITKALLRKSNGDISFHKFGDLWPYALHTMLGPIPFGISGGTYCKFLTFCRQKFGPLKFEQVVRFSRMLITAPEWWHEKQAWYQYISCNYRAASTCFTAIIVQEADNDYKTDPILKSALQDIGEGCDSLESSRIHKAILARLENKEFAVFIKPDADFRQLEYPETLFIFHELCATRLLLVLILNAPTIQLALASEEAIQHAMLVVSNVQRCLAFYPAKFSVVWVVVASLVHRISQIPEIAIIAISILRQWAGPEVSETVERYWADPEHQFEKMFTIVKEFWKDWLHVLGETDKGYHE